MDSPTGEPQWLELDATSAYRLAARKSKCCRAALLGAVLVCLLFSRCLAASLPEKIRTVQGLEAVRELGAPRAFVKGNEVRLYYTNSAIGKELVFNGSWKKTPLEIWDYKYHAAVLRFDKSPPKIPARNTSWTEATVLDRQEWAKIASVAMERLTPSNTDHGIYFQSLDSDAVFYRDDLGRIKAAAFDRKPNSVVIDQRYNAQEFTVALARAAEAQLLSAYPSNQVFLVTQSIEGETTGFFLLDVARRRCVLLSAPHLQPDPGGGFELDTSLRSLVSITLESHGFALIKNPISSVARLLNLTVQTLSSLASPSFPPHVFAPVPAVTQGMDIDAWEKHLDKLIGRPRDRGSVKFLIDGENFFPVFQQRLAEAQHNIHLHIGMFDTDDVAVDIANQLRQRSSEVQVKVLLDRMSSLAVGAVPPTTPMPEGFVPPKSIGAYLEHGSKVSVRPFLNPWFTADHCKVLMIDNRYAYIGGMNIGREYRYEWHDLMAEIEGPIVAHYEQDFERAWAHASALGDLAYAEKVLFGKQPRPKIDETKSWAELRRLYTRTASTQIRRAEMEAFDWAQNHIYLENPYLWDREVLASLTRARLRGVDVRVIFPADNDITGGRSSNFVIANYFLRNGVRVFIYPGMTHVKALNVDGWCCFGSANFSKLGLRINQEANIATSDPDIVSTMRQQLFDRDFAKSHELTQPFSVNWTDGLLDTVLSQF